MNDWFDARIAARQPEAAGLTSVELDVAGTPLVGSHLQAGQYVKVKVEGKGESYLAIASAPAADGRRFELLLKHGAAVPDALLGSALGSRVQVSLPQGKGFPLARARGKNLLLFATGSGISPIRSTIGVIREDRPAFGEVTLYFGARTPDAFAYEKELTSWEQAGVKVIRTVSQPGASGWTGLTGYVQAHLEQVKPDTVAFLCGQKQMVQGVTAALAALGVTQDNIFLNF